MLTLAANSGGVLHILDAKPHRRSRNKAPPTAAEKLGELGARSRIVAFDAAHPRPAGAHAGEIWLQPVMLASSSGFASHELKKLVRLVEEHQRTFVEAWNEFFGA